MTFKLVRASYEHCDLLYNWVNEKLVRENSFNKDKISYESHEKWFYNKLNSSNSIIYILYIKENIPVGQIRIDIENNIGFIGYSIDKDYRGKGFGTQILYMIVEQIKKEKRDIKKLIGKVKYSNIASQKAFEKTGYKSSELEDYIEYHFDLT